MTSHPYLLDASAGVEATSVGWKIGGVENWLFRDVSELDDGVEERGESL